MCSIVEIQATSRHQPGCGEPERHRDPGRAAAFGEAHGVDGRKVAIARMRLIGQANALIVATGAGMGVDVAKAT